jgi:hypothetical protein
VANFACPYCDQVALFPQTSLWMNGRFVNGAGPWWVTMIQCPNLDCAGIVTAAFTAMESLGRPIATLPRPTVKIPNALIPAPVRADVFEARMCYSVGAYKGTAVLCRRALQGACVEQGANPKKKLHGQIEEVVEANKVHGSLKDWADAIRLIGNSGAHVGDDGLEDVTHDEADDILAFTEEFMELTYVARERVKQRLAERRPQTSPDA